MCSGQSHHDKQIYNKYNYIGIKMEVKWKEEETALTKAPIIKVPLQFLFEPVEILSKELTKLNSPYPYRILYLGPRWDNSSLTHKKFSRKHAYTFNEKQINTNSTFFNESMSQNQFYRNQVYYRAFEGMNPTIQKEEELQFDSRFESGNLDCVVKVSEEEYDLFLRIDSNTKGHIFWFNFSVGNGKVGSVIRFNICNLTKSKSLYEKGFKPYSSVKSENGDFLNWTQDHIQSLKIQQKKLRYDFIYQKIKVRPLYQLSFSYTFSSSNQVRFAYCIPYTYTQLLKEINELGSNASTGYIGKSLTGIDIPVIKVGSFDENMEKSVVFMMGRLHPGESNGSIVLSGLMKHLCLSQEASYLRKKIVTVIVPMINPDGVILGNSRTGAAGKDLNRQFKTKNKNLFPQVNLIKKFVETIQETHDIQIFIDFHGHSRKKNMFSFGPNYNLTQPEYYKARVIPKYLSQLTSIFRYFGCTYTIPQCKATTARAVMLNEIGIPLVYTIETSVGMYYDYESHKDLCFTQAKWEEAGMNVCRAIRQYFQSVEQYEQFLKLRSIEQELYRKGGKEKGQKSEKGEKGKVKESKIKKIVAKDVKLIKLFEQIKASEMNNLNRKKDDQSDESDSQNDDDNLEKMKMAEFEGMVTQCIEVEIKRKQETEKLLGKKKEKSPPRVQKNIRKRKAKLFTKQELGIGTDVNVSEKEKEKLKNEEIFVFRNEKKSWKGNSLECGHKRENEERVKREDKLVERNQRNIEYERLISNNQFFELDQKSEVQNPAKNRSNIRMFNFSKMVDEQQSRSIMTSGRYRQESDFYEKKNHLTFIKKQQLSTPSSINKPPNKKYFHLSLDQHFEAPEDSQVHEGERGEKKKVKGVFPAPFYRIKYQNYQKKKLKSLEYNRKEEEGEVESVERGIEKRKKKNEILFLKIKKVES